MKTIKNLLLMLCGVASIVLCSSCEDFLDKQEDEALTFDKIWLTKENTRRYWLNAMSFLPDDANNFNYSPWVGASDEGTVTYARDTRWINFGSWNPNMVPYYQMASYYNGIRECNIFLLNADRCLTHDPTLLKEDLEVWKAQTRFARAYYYFMMMRIYGPVFLLGDELLDFTASTEALYRPRNTWEECVDYVVSEMTACAESPAIKSTWERDGEKGLATKGTCQAVIARLKLYSARDLFNGNTLYAGVRNPDGTALFPQTYNANKWLEAAQAAKIIMDSGLYELYTSDNNNPYQNYYGITQVLWNKELIWTTGYKSRSNLGIHTAPTGLSGIHYGGVGPTQQQVDAYAMNNGRYPITSYESDGTPVVDPASGYNENEFQKTTWTYPAWGNAPAYSLSAPNMYKNREPRFYVTVFFGGSRWFYNGTSYTLISFAKGANSNKSHDYPKSGYLINRFYDHTVNSTAGTWGNITFPTFRLAEVYLNFIESVLECKKRNVAMPAGYEDAAMEAWTKIRERVGLPAITDVYPEAASNTEQLIELCRRERRIELAFENHRYFDTRTWMIAPSVDAGPMYGMNTQEPSSGTTTPDGFWKRTVFETRVFSPKHYLYPFSQRELDRNKLLIQNYGW
jgi:hypothetical protein